MIQIKHVFWAKELSFRRKAQIGHKEHKHLGFCIFQCWKYGSPLHATHPILVIAIKLSDRHHPRILEAELSERLISPSVLLSEWNTLY
jgi:hypothetical protein